jgi:hypothetical protein
MEYAQQVIRGQWSRVAFDENGSLIIQCIFENSSAEQKLLIVDEIFENIVDIAKGITC